MVAFSVIVFALVTMVACDKAPYPAAGSKPAKVFLLPLRQGAPAPYTVPAPAPVSFEAPVAFTAPIYPYAAAPVAAELTNAKQQVEKVTPTVVKTEGPVNAGQYYVLSPEGKLQKVEYFTADQPQSEIAQKIQQFNARTGKAQPFKAAVSNFQYKDVEPITAPIFSYSNVPGPLVRILRNAENF